MNIYIFVYYYIPCSAGILYIINVVAKHKRALFLSEFVNGMNNTFRGPVVCVVNTRYWYGKGKKNKIKK